MNKILIIAATEGELTTLRGELAMPSEEDTVIVNDRVVRVVCSGIGAVAAAICTTQEILTYKPSLVLQIGIAGSYRRDIRLGSLIEVRQEREADLGIEQSDGSIRSLAESGLLTRDEIMKNPHDLEFNFPHGDGLTVQTVTGTKSRLVYLSERFEADVESMEGAGFFKSCLQYDIPFGQIRAISNYVESRNRENWEIELALTNLGREIAATLKKK